MPAAVTPRRQLRSIDGWHRAARWQVAGTLCLVPRRRRQAACSDQRRAQPSSIEAGADPAASCKPLFSERVGEQPRSKLRHRGALRGAAGASSLLAGRRHSSAAASIDRWLASGGAMASRRDVARALPPRPRRNSEIGAARKKGRESGGGRREGAGCCPGRSQLTSERRPGSRNDKAR